MSCGCDQQNSSNALDFAGLQSLATDQNALYFFIQGVKVGQQIRAADQAKWQRMGIILAVAFGAITFLKHMNE